MNIKDFPKVQIELRPSLYVKGGVGLFASRDMKKGTIISEAIKEGLNPVPEFAWSDYEKIDDETKVMVDHFCLGSEYGFSMPLDFNYLPVAWYINHSCDGSVGFDENGNFVLIKDVMKNDELAYDYGIAENNPKFRMKCLCGASLCRGIISGDDWKDSGFRELNLKYMTPELRMKIQQIS